MSFTDFKAGLENANDYLDTRHHLSGTTALGNDSLRFVASAEYSFTLRELLCSVLSGNGIKMPNLQICLYANIQELLGIPNIQAQLYDALNQLADSLQQFMDHTRLDDILGRLNAVLAEAQNVANLINFCAQPVDPIAIPNMLERAFGSFLGAGKEIIDSIGQIAPGQMCACLTPGGFNTNAFSGGLLGNLGNNLSRITSGSLLQDELDAITNDVRNIANQITNLINFENNITGSYLHGGSQFATPDAGCYTEVGVMHNPGSANISTNARLTSSLKSLYDRLAGYPVQYNYNGEITEYPNIFHVLLDQEMLDLLDRTDDPNPTIENQIPVYDYCGNVIGYTANIIQQDNQTSEGSTPTVPNSPGYNAGGFTTADSSTNTGSTIQNTTVEYTVSTGSGSSNVYIVANEAAQLALQTNTHDIVVRSDIITTFVRKDTASFNSGTMSDYQQASVTFTAFGENVNNLTGVGFVVKDGDVAITRLITGAANQISVTNTSGSGGDVVIGLAENTEIPGTGAVKIPVGTTAQRPTAERGKVRYNSDNDKIEAYYNDTSSWRSLATLADLTSQQTTLINIGSGVDVFKQLNTSNQNELRRLNNTGLITLTQNANDITISDSLTVSNTGSGAGVFKQRSGNDLQLRTLVGVNNVTVTQNTDTVEVAGDPRIKYATLQTTSNTTTDVTFDSITGPSSGKAWFFTVEAIASNTATTRQAFKVEGVVQNDGSTTSLVGVPLKIDYQRNTTDTTHGEWVVLAGYNSGDTVEYDLNVYQANTTIVSGSSSSTTPPPTNGDWTVIYTGWNTSAVIDGTGNFKIRVKGDSQTINWSLRFSYLEA